MAGEDVWSFISYAHDDNLPTGGGADEEGFVSFLERMLEVQLRDIGAQEAKLWRDAKRFSNGDPFDAEIEDALKKSAILIVVMSPNWLKRPYCLKELDAFVRLRKMNGVDRVEERIIVVGKQYVARENRPEPLRVQEGFSFFDRDAENDVSAEKRFFDGGKICDPRFLKIRDALAELLGKRVQRVVAGGAMGTLVPPDVRIAGPTGRTVYLAKPAADMEQAYGRLALELQGRGYSVVPDVSANIPNTGARDYIDAGTQGRRAVDPSRRREVRLRAGRGRPAAHRQAAADARPRTGGRRTGPQRPEIPAGRLGRPRSSRRTRATRSPAATPSRSYRVSTSKAPPT